jgi:hypothetical protein
MDPPEGPGFYNPPASNVKTLALVVWAVMVAAVTSRVALHEVAWPDEFIYLVGARNLVERGSLDTNFYLTHSLLARGYPHRDVHMPGYALVLAPFVAWRGAGLDAAAALNLPLFVGSILLVHAIARRLLEDETQAAAAAALAAVAPPWPAYLFVAYPEIVVGFVLLAGVAWLLRGGGPGHAAFAGLLWAMGALFRESLLLALPIYLARLPRRLVLRAFAPAAAFTLLALAPLAAHRAVHPNALFPSLLEDARRSADPVGTLAGALRRNVGLNLQLAAAADPVHNPEDTALLVIAALGVLALAALPLLPKRGRALGVAVLLSMAALGAAVVLFYVVRERGGVWGGVRAAMPWVPLLVVLALPLAFRVRPRPLALGLVLAAGLAFAAIDRQEIRFLNHYKAANLEDQSRYARYIASYVERYHPQRIVARVFVYGFWHYPVEVIWSPPSDMEELHALENTVPFDFLVIHENSPLRLGLIGNARYLRVNKEDRGAELLIWRRLY